MRTVRIGLESRLTVCVCWLDGVVAAGDVSADILRPLTEGGRLADVTGSREAVRRIEQGAVYSCATRTRTQMDALVADLTKGSAALIFDAQRKAVTFEARTANVRAVSEPTIEKSVSGCEGRLRRDAAHQHLARAAAAAHAGAEAAPDGRRAAVGDHRRGGISRRHRRPCARAAHP